MMASPVNPGVGAIDDPSALPTVESTPKKKGRTNTPWTAEEEQRLKTMRDAGRSWSEIAKVRGFSFNGEGVRSLIWESISRLSLLEPRAVSRSTGTR